jgi:hypothetical protein
MKIGLNFVAKKNPVLQQKRENSKINSNISFQRLKKDTVSFTRNEDWFLEEVDRFMKDESLEEEELLEAIAQTVDKDHPDIKAFTDDVQKNHKRTESYQYEVIFDLLPYIVDGKRNRIEDSDEYMSAEDHRRKYGY